MLVPLRLCGFLTELALLGHLLGLHPLCGLESLRPLDVLLHQTIDGLLLILVQRDITGFLSLLTLFLIRTFFLRLFLLRILEINRI